MKTRYVKGVPLLQKVVYEREMVGPRGGASPYRGGLM